MRSKLSLIPLALILLLALNACAVAPNRRVSRATPQPPVVLNRASALVSQADCGPTASVKPPTTGSHASTISNAYQGILRLFIKPVNSSSLLNAAWQGAENEISKENVPDPGIASPQLPGTSPDADWQAFAASYDTLSQSVDGKVDQVQMAFSAISKMADSVDEGHTFFVDPETYAHESQEQVLSGGIGVVLNGKKSPFVVEEVVSGAPADQAGLRPGDSIISVDGCDVSNWDSEQLRSHVTGQAGTSVHLTLSRPSSGNYAVDVTRARVTFPDITSQMLPQGVGYIHLHEFPSPNSVLTGGTRLAPALTNLLSSFQSQGARGWILDLRGNPGGEVDGVQVVGGLVLPPGLLFSAKDRAGHASNTRTIGTRVTAPPLLAVLVDKGSASGAEILASAIQDDAVAPVLGTQTAGVANEAQLIGIGDGAGVSVTVAQTYGPQGRPLNGEGLVPDITVERTPEDLAAGADPVLDLALRLPGPPQTKPAAGSGQ
jgi:carboxyl-terminal processing protease